MRGIFFNHLPQENIHRINILYEHTHPAATVIEHVLHDLQILSGWAVARCVRIMNRSATRDDLLVIGQKVHALQLFQDVDTSPLNSGEKISIEVRLQAFEQDRLSLLVGNRDL